jgi:radical SAM enzyme (TIGR01210 family)
MHNDFSEILSGLRSVMSMLRTDTPVRAFSRDSAASSDIRTGYLDGRPVKRLVVTLRAPGCDWVTRGGGCTMCGHYAGTIRGDLPSASDTVSQFVGAIEAYDLSGIEVVSVYNSGSMLNPCEMRPDALRTVCSIVGSIHSVGKLVLESRAEYVDPGTVADLVQRLGHGKRLSIAIGLESVDDEKRELCMNKGCPLDVIENAVRSIAGIADTQLYILLGLPFLTESEMIDDSVMSIRYAHEIGADEIHIEPATLQRHTLAYLLATEGLYRLPSLHSLYEVLKRVVPDIRPYVSPFLHMPTPDRIPEGCPECTGRLISGLLDRYNYRLDRASLDYEPCTCMDVWRARLAEHDVRPLHRRVADALGTLAAAHGV